MRLTNYTKKLLLLLTLLTLTTGLTAADGEISITEPSDEIITNSEFDITVSLEGVDDNFDEDITIEREHSEDSTEIGTIEDIGGNGEYTLESEWDSSQEESEVFNITAEVDDDDVEKSEPLTVYWHDEEPNIIDDDIDVTKNEDGSIGIEWGAEISEDAGVNPDDEENVELDEFRLNRTEQEELVDSSGSGGLDDDRELTDDNEDNNYTEIVYELIVEDEAGNVETHEMDVLHVFDGIAPELVETSIGDEEDLDYVEHINEDSVEVEVEVEDLLSGINYANLTYSDNESVFDSIDNSDSEDEPNETLELVLDLENLDEGEHDLELEVEDNAGEEWEDDGDNSETYEWSFVVDTEAPEPEASLIPSPDETEFITGTTSFVVDIDESDGAVYAECFVNDVPHGNDFGSAELDDDEFDCGRLDPEDYSEGSNDIYVRFEDEAGNRETKNLGSFIFDTEDPEIDSFDITPQYTNEEPNVTVEASDSGSDVTSAEYMFSDDVDEGDGRSIDFDSDGRDVEFDFQPDLSSREDGEYEVYVRVQDRSGKWSDVVGNNFTLDREAVPDPVIEFDEVVIEDGQENARVDVSNEGDVPLVSSVLSVDGVVEGESREFEVLGNDERGVMINMTTEEEFGEYTDELTLHSSTTSLDHEFDVLIRANDDEEEKVEDRLSEVETVLDNVNDNISMLEEEGASEEIVDDLRESRNELEAVYESADDSVEDELYYEVAGSLDDLETLSQESEDAKEKAIDERTRERRMFYLQMFGFLVVLGGGTGIFALYRSDYEIDVDQLDNLNFDRGFVNGLSLASVAQVPGAMATRVQELAETVIEEEEEAASAYEDISWS